MLTGGLLNTNDNQQQHDANSEMNTSLEEDGGDGEGNDFYEEEESGPCNDTSQGSRYFDPPVENYRFMEQSNHSGFYIDTSQRKNEFVSQSHNALIKNNANDLKSRKSSTSDFNVKGNGSFISHEQDNNVSGINNRATDLGRDDDEVNDRTYDGLPSDITDVISEDPPFMH